MVVAVVAVVGVVVMVVVVAVVVVVLLLLPPSADPLCNFVVHKPSFVAASFGRCAHSHIARMIAPNFRNSHACEGLGHTEASPVIRHAVRGHAPDRLGGV